jgi:hypothetical protein
MKCVQFFIQGQFGNNLFQYFAAEIIKKIYEYDEVKPTFIINLEFNTVIDDTIFKRIITMYLEGKKYELDTNKDILMMGYFQRSEIFKEFYEYNRNLFSIENTNNISNRIKICNIVKYKTNNTIELSENDLVMHVRLGDFLDRENNTSQISCPNDLTELIKTITYDKLYIVCNKLETDWEKEYLERFSYLNPEIVSGNLGDDFDFLLRAKKIITSASTMSWMGAYLGNANEIYIPYNTTYGGFEGTGQHLADFNDKCKVLYSISNWFPKEKSEDL